MALRLLLVPLACLLFSSAPTEAQRRATAGTIRRTGARAPVIPSRVVVAGRVLAPDGKPAVGARLYMRAGTFSPNPDFAQASADSEGRFSKALHVREGSLPRGVQLPGFARDTGRLQVAVTALLPGKAVLRRTFTLKGATLSNLTLRLRPGASLTGQLRRLDGSPAAGIGLSIAELAPDPRRAVAADGTFSIFAGAGFVPEPTLRRYYRTRTDNSGGFSLTALPTEVQARLRIEGDLVLAPGSAQPIAVEGASAHDAGLLFVAQPGGLKVNVIGAATGKAAAAATVSVRRERSASGLFGNPTGESLLAAPDSETDEHGAAEFPRLLPGAWLITVNGRTERVMVEEGQVSGPLRMTVRVGPLKGRVVDAGGKAVQGVEVTLEVKNRPGPAGQAGLAVLFGGSAFQADSTTTDPDGEFQFAPFPWHAGPVSLRARRGNELAEWQGPAETLPEPLELRLQPDVLVSVTGRLVDPHRRPVRGTDFWAIRWLETPRATWLATAIQGRSGKDGRFRVDGLRRGESFSILGLGLGLGFQPEARPGSPVRAFESPRFTTDRAAATVNLGDVVVHPLEEGSQVLRLYGFDDPEQLRDLIALMPAPAPESVRGAREALVRYRTALRAGDLATVRSLTARGFAPWADDPREFLLHGTFHRPPSASAHATRPVRFVPRLFPTAFLAFLEAEQNPQNGLAFGAAARALERDPDWVFLAEARDGRVRTAGILRREQGEWRIVLPNLPGSEDLLDATGGRGGGAPLAGSFGRPLALPGPAGEAAARAAGERYLAAWTRGDLSSLYGLTSPASPAHAGDLRAFRRAFAQRADEGACPVAAGSPVRLELVRDLAAWEQEWLANYTLQAAEIGSLGAGRDRTARPVAGFPREMARRGDLVAFRYQAQGRALLMLLTRLKRKWQVLEPALPL